MLALVRNVCSQLEHILIKDWRQPSCLETLIEQQDTKTCTITACFTLLPLGASQALHQQMLPGKFVLQVDEAVDLGVAAKER